MKLPWDKKYIRIAFHAVIGVGAAYALIALITLAALMLKDFPAVWKAIAGALGKFLSAFSFLIAGFIIAYMLDPLVGFYDRLWRRFRRKAKQRRVTRARLCLPDPARPRGAVRKLRLRHKPIFGGRRAAGTILCFATLLLAIFLLAAVSVARLGSSGVDGAADTAGTAVSSVSAALLALSEAYAAFTLQMENWGIGGWVQKPLSELSARLSTGVSAVADKLPEFISSAGGLAANIFIGLFLAFFFLRDKKRIKAASLRQIRLFLPKRAAEALLGGLSQVNDVFSSYIRGQLTVSLIMGTLFSIAFTLLGMDFAVLIGIFSGAANIIPYFGAIVAFVLAVLAALISGEPIKALYAAIVIIVIQQIDNLFISPRVVGRSVRLSPVMVLIAITAGGALFGIWGMVVAVPVFALMKSLVQRLIARRAEAKAMAELREVEERLNRAD